MHEGTTQDVPQVGIDRYDNFMFRHMITHPFEQQMGLLSLICGGVLERHPGLRALVVEAGVGWVPYWMERMDHHVEAWGFASAPLPLTPSEYFRRQCFVSADAEETLLPFVVQAVGDENVCFSTDYPHPDHEFEGIVAQLTERQDLPEASKRRILGPPIRRELIFGKRIIETHRRLVLDWSQIWTCDQPAMTCRRAAYHHLSTPPIFKLTHHRNAIPGLSPL